MLAGLLAGAALATGACAEAGSVATSGQVAARSEITANAHASARDEALADRILGLDPEHIAERDVREALARGPAPRIINLHGSVALITMREFAQFLVTMGYPEGQVRNP